MKVVLDAETGNVLKVNGVKAKKTANKNVNRSANESVSGTNAFGVNGKCPRANKRHALKDAVIRVETKQRGRRKNIQGAMTLEQWKEKNGR